MSSKIGITIAISTLIISLGLCAKLFFMDKNMFYASEQQRITLQTNTPDCRLFKSGLSPVDHEFPKMPKEIRVYRDKNGALFVEKRVDPMTIQKEVSVAGDLSNVPGVMRLACIDSHFNSFMTPFYRGGLVIYPELDIDIMRNRFAQIMISLSYINMIGYAHLDLHHGNILMNGEHTVIIDFGQSKRLDSDGWLAGEFFCGHCPNAAPETKSFTFGKYLQKADIYQVGSLFKNDYFPNNMSNPDIALFHDLLEKMTAYDFDQRISFEGIKEHEFLKPINLTRLETEMIR
jgi:serine/threonine protein kinase